MRLATAVASLFLGALISSVGTSPTPVQAYNLLWVDGNQAGGRFDHNVVTYFIDGNIPGWFDDSINNAADAWTAAEGSSNSKTNLFFEVGGTSATTADVHISAYTVDDNKGGNGGCQAVVNGICPSRSGDGYAKYNFSKDNSPPQSNPVGDQWLAGHEQGHSFGLDHSCTIDSIMSGPAPPCQKQPYGCRTATPDPNCYPEADDGNGVIAMYGQYQTPPAPVGTCYVNDAPKLTIGLYLQSLSPGDMPLNSSDLYIYVCPF